jgi:hypothetical protein
MRARGFGALLVVLALAGCGSGSSASPDTIAQDAAKTARAGSVKADFTVSGGGAHGKGSGVFNTGAERSSRSSMQIGVRNNVSKLETIVAANVLYLRSRVFAQAGVSGPLEWVKLDLGRLAQQRREGDDAAARLR